MLRPCHPRPPFLLAALCTALLCLAAPAGRSAQSRPLNLLMITADDLNADSMGWMGGLPNLTPNLDAFAALASRFEQCHTTVPICQPCRSAVLTGRVPHRNGALGFNPIRADVPTLMELLRSRNYRTAILNKIPHSAVKPGMPSPWDQEIGGNAGRNPAEMYAGVRSAIEAATQTSRPFFVNANITDPHRPFVGGQQRRMPGGAHVAPVTPEEARVPSFLEDIPTVRREVAHYLTSVRRCDQSFGEILRALRDTGQEQRTLVLFFSDHGMSFPFSKATVYRNGTWTPLLVRWPGMARTVVDRRNLVSTLDILPTVLDILDVPHPPGLDGRTLLPLLRGETQPERDYVVTHVNTVSSGRSFSQRCVRTQTRSYLWSPWSDGQTRLRVEAMNGLTFAALEAAGAGDERLAARVRQYVTPPVEQLFDLEKDPDERVNRLGDPAYAADARRLRRILLEHMRRTEDPMAPAFPKVE